LGMKKRSWLGSRGTGMLLWLFVLAGIAMIVYPRIDSRIQEQKQLELLSEWSREIQTTYSGKQPDSGEERGINDDAVSLPLPQWKSVDGQQVLGSIRIEKLDLVEPIVRGASEQALLQGAGTVLDDELPGQKGNFVLAGHRSWTFGRHFNRLGELATGDLIVIDTSVGPFRYEVTETVIVTPDDVSVLDVDGDNAELTLITCHPKRNPTHRLIVKAALQPAASQ